MIVYPARDVKADEVGIEQLPRPAAEDDGLCCAGS